MQKIEKGKKSLAFSVSMCTYGKDNPDWLKTATDSILNGTVTPDEVVLVVDGPVPDTHDAVIREYEQNPIFKVIRLEKNMGHGEARRIGLENCTNELVALMDSDDISAKDRFQKQLECFAKNDALSIVSGTILEFVDDINIITGKRIVPTTHDEICIFSRKRNPFNHPVVMFKKSVILKNGGYSDFPYFEDYELFVRCLLNGAKGENAVEPLLYMRVGNGMYKRRGGKAYVGHTLRFYNHMEKMGMCSIKEKLFCVYPRILVALMPVKLREFVYKKMLRG